MNVNIPFHEGTGPVPYEKFGGRRSFCADFEKSLKSPSKLVWIIEGPKGYGKSSFATWCVEMVRKNPALGAVVCYITLREQFPSGEQIRAGDFNSFVADQVNLRIVRHSKLEQWFRKGRKCWEALSGSGLSTPSGGFQLGGHGKKYCEDWKSFLSALRRWGRHIRDQVKSVIVILDEVSTRPGAEKLAWDLARNLKEDEWPTDLPKFGLIILALPGWRSRAGSEVPTRHFTHGPDMLKPFAYTETSELVAQLCRLYSGPAWKFDSGFVDSLHAMSGGIPSLVQSIGYAACAECIEDGLLPGKASRDVAFGQYDLESQHVERAVRDNHARIRNAVTDIIDDSGYQFNKTAAEAALLTAFSNRPLQSREIKEGLTKEVWRKYIVKQAQQEQVMAFDDLWGRLCAAGLLVSTGATSTKYKVCAEAVRMGLKSLFSS